MKPKKALINKPLRSVLSKRHLVLGAFFLACLLIFNTFLLRQLTNTSPFAASGPDAIYLQTTGEIVRQRLIQGQNIFSPFNQFVYPFAFEPALSDVGLLFLPIRLLTRPLLTPLSSDALSVLCFLFLAQLSMYAFLRNLKIHPFLAAIVSVNWAFAPFIVFPRLEHHYTYATHFLFPLFSFCLMQLLQSKKTQQTIFLILCTGLVFAFFYYASVYFFAFILITLALTYFILFFVQKAKAISLIKHNWPKLLGVVSTSLILLYPVFLSLLTVLPLKRPGFDPSGSGYLDYSANFLSLFIPSRYHYFYAHVFRPLFYRLEPLEGVIYPGLIALFGLFISVKKHFFNDPIQKILFFLALILYLFTLGPHFQWLSFWRSETAIQLLRIPLPFYALMQFPILQQLRSPVRFGIPLTFILLVLSSLSLNRYFQSKTATKRHQAFILLGFVSFIDLFFVIPTKPKTITLPTNLYNYISTQTTSVSSPILHLPLTLRGNTLAYGDKDNLDFMLAKPLLNHPFIGGMMPRVTFREASYYAQCPILNQALSTSESSNETDPLVTPQQLAVEADLLDLQYLVVDRSRYNMENSFFSNLQSIGFYSVLEQTPFALYSRPTKPHFVETLDFTEPNLCLTYAGLSQPFNGYRFISSQNPRAGFILKPESLVDRTLVLESVNLDIKRQAMIYLNNRPLKTVILSPGINQVEIKSLPLKPGLNNFDVIIKDTQQYRSLSENPAQVIIGLSKASLR